MHKICKKIILVLIITIAIFSFGIVSAQNTLTLVSDPPEVLTLDPEALTKTLTDYPGVPIYIIDAKQTVTSGETTYEFSGWGEGTEDWPDDPEYPAPPLNGNQAFVILDGSKTITAYYTTPNTLTLVTDPPEVLTIDPEALTMTLTDCPYVPVYIIDAKQTVASGDTVYDFIGWSETDTWPGEPEEEPDLTGNQAFIILDASKTVTAYYSTPNTLTLKTDPPEVLTIDPEALTMTLTDYPWVPIYIIDAKQTIISGGIHYEFVGWSGPTEDWPNDPEYPAPPLTGNQAFVILDGSKSITAIYEKIVEWKYIMADEDNGAILNVNTDTEQFQFSTPTKDFGVKQADLMIVSSNILNIWHSDSDILLTVFAITDPRIDFCLAVARDRQTGQTYVLRDRIGQE